MFNLTMVSRQSVFTYFLMDFEDNIQYKQLLYKIHIHTMHVANVSLVGDPRKSLKDRDVTF